MTGIFGSGGMGSASSSVADVDAAISGGSSVAAEAGVVLEVSAEFVAGSAMGVVLVADIQLDLNAGASLAADATVSGNSAIALAGGSTIVASGTVAVEAVVSMSAGSGFGASVDYDLLNATSGMTGASEVLGDATFLGAFGDDSYGGSPYGGAYPPFGLESAIALSATQVRVRYSAIFDPGYPLLLAVSNYSISPTITINSIALESAQTVLLNTSALITPFYTVTISEARGYFNQPLDLARNSAQFIGVGVSPTFYAVATGRRRVRVVFSEEMLQNASLINPSQYILTDLSGASVTIASVITEQLSGVRSTVLQLGADLVDERHYRVTVLSGVVSLDSAPVSPDTAVFQWVENSLQAQIPVKEFSGEVLGGLYGIHGGLVFFSPALQSPASSSIIQVEEVDVCTKAYDEYHFPQPIDPRALMLHGAGVVPTPIVTTLNSSDVLWVGFPRLVDAKFELGVTSLGDTISPPVDGPCEATLTETWPAIRVALLNNTDWKLFDNLGNPPAYFITADNLTPFPPGASVFNILSLTLAGEAIQGAEADVL